MTEPPQDWLPALLRALQSEPVVVRIVLAEVRGSAPREPGVNMLVDRAGIVGTIGGGQLEWDMLAEARSLLQDARVPARVLRRVLGTDLGQCCGGVVEVWMERFTRADLELLRAAHAAASRGNAVLISSITRSGVERRILRDLGMDPAADRLLRAPHSETQPILSRRLDRPAGTPAADTPTAGAPVVTLSERLDAVLLPVWLYGAGHVGRALAKVLMDLPLRLTWIDSRAEQFPAAPLDIVRILNIADPVASVAAAPRGTCFVVMTHSHPLDYALCRAILLRNDFAWAGLIGSISKAARFRSRLAREGVDRATIAKLACPIGVSGITSKWPAAIAVSVAAQLLREMNAAQLERGPQHERARQLAMPGACAQSDCASCVLPS